MTSIGDVIFCRQNMSSSNSDGSSNMWDDQVLVESYDKALTIAKEKVAQRLAMKTNSTKDKNSSNDKTMCSEMKKQNKKLKWQVGSECRAIYSEDGLEYEASILYIDGDMCIVSFAGYNNEEEVNLSSLKPSLGKNQRLLQNMEAKYAPDNKETQFLNGFLECQSDSVSNHEQKSTNQTKTRKKKRTRKNRNNTMDESSFSHFSSFPLPPLNSNIHIDSSLPLPPPPHIPPINGSNLSQEEQALSTMLISWYMSGYYTGLYQGQKLASRNNHKRDL